MPVILEPGLMGSIIDPETNMWVRHRVGLYMGITSFLSIAMMVAKTFFPSLRTATDPATTPKEAARLVAVYIVISAIYISNIGNDMPRFEDTWWLEHRLKIMVGLHVLYSALYFVFKRILATRYGLEPIHCNTTAANAIRVLVKLAMFLYWVPTGEIFKPVLTHPLALTREVYETTHHVSFAINSLYIWEVMFRELKPVNVIHHGIACAGFTSFAEWQNVLEPARTNTSLPILGSLIEGFCCLGSICYRFMARGRTLQRIMIALTIFVLVSYNVLLVGYCVLLHAYIDLYSFGYGYICMPALVFFTYPAQMNMAKIYWGMSKRSLVEPKAAVPVVEEPVAAPRVMRRQRA